MAESPGVDPGIGSTVELQPSPGVAPISAMCIGRGGQAFVVTSRVLGSDIAVKVFARWKDGTLTADATHRRACRNESLALERVSGRSEFIIRQHRTASLAVRVPLPSGPSEQLAADCIVMDECAGTLHFAMVGLHHVWGASRASMAQRVFTATAVLVELVGAAHACHTSGIAHMDIKPENVLIDKRGCTKLADFGHAVGNSAGSPTAALGIVDVAKTTGFTAWWAAPEVNARYSPIDAAKADVWSIGCVYFSLVMGVHPLHVDGAPEALHRRDFGGFWRVHRAAAHGSPLHDPAAESFICIAEAMLDSDPRSRVSTSVLTQAAWMKAATPAFHAELHKTLLKAIHDGTILHFSKELTLGAPAPEQSRPADPGLSVASARQGGAPLARAAPSRIAVPSLAPAGAGPPPSAGPAAAASSAAAAGSAAACAAPAAVSGRYVDAGSPSPRESSTDRRAGPPVSHPSRYNSPPEGQPSPSLALLPSLNQEAIKAASYTALVRCDPAAFFHQLGGFVRLLDDRATRKAGKPVRRFTHGGNAFVLQLFEREDGGEGVRIVIEAENDGMEHMARQQGRSLERWLAATAA
ncbi:hypothetical protein FNF27_07670 [Cafeteria roenbergensis]|uniref:Protein kinase domain-containing protein n=2 Tax=Cafeteria roenbergensis TaxID=33653 RepID=A0A5A8DL60_CAFRO|nr:hypothetical protein FNF27_07670 [Cafeteria roenbergensis]